MHVRNSPCDAGREVEVDADGGLEVEAETEIEIDTPYYT